MKLLFRLSSWLVLPLALLLFAQWPLRELLRSGAREANDLGQVLFALYAAVAVTAASAAGTHLAAHRPAAASGSAGLPAAGRGRVIALFACVAPWAAFVLWNAAPGVWAGLAQFEKFPDTLDPGYFVIRFAVWLLALLALVHGLRAVLGAVRNR